MSDVLMYSFLTAILAVLFSFWLKALYTLLVGKTYGGYVIYLIYNKETKATSTKILCFTLVLRTFDPDKVIHSITQYMEDKADQIMEERGNNPNEGITVLSVELLNKF